MKGFGVILLVITLLASTLPCSAQDPIPFNELARESSSSFSFADARADYGGQAASSTPNFKIRHWTRGGKIMTFIGLPLLAIGGVTIGSTLNRGCRQTGPYGRTCLGEDIVVTGEVFLTATGTALTIVGATWRSTE
jgi:hypothetical protein